MRRGRPRVPHGAAALFGYLACRAGQPARRRSGGSGCLKEIGIIGMVFMRPGIE
jgi:hypothetical protein